MRIPLPTPEPPELGRRDGLAYALFLPEEQPRAGIVICHGAGSAKESHFDFGRAARGTGIAALAFDARGHGRSDGEFGPSAFDDVLVMVGLMREHTPNVALRGSSMGGFCALNAAALADPPLAAVVAICPATEDLLLRGVRSERLTDFRMDRDAIEPWLQMVDTRLAVESLAGQTALLFMHARGDEQVPYTLRLPVIRCKSGGPSMLQEPSSCRTYQPPRDSPSRSDSSKSNVWAPSGKCPQKMTVWVHTLRMAFAALSPVVVTLWPASWLTLPTETPAVSALDWTESASWLRVWLGSVSIGGIGGGVIGDTGE